MKSTVLSSLFAASVLACLAPGASAQTRPAATPPASQSQQKPQPQQAPTQKPATRPATSSTSSEVRQAATSVERDLGIFRDWVNDKIDRAETGARRDLPRVMDEFDYQSKRIDKAVDSLSAQGKREYGNLKSRYHNWESEQRRLQEGASQPRTAQQAQTEMLGENVNLAAARATEMHDLYGRFIDYVRVNRREWDEEDWAVASNVLTKLNTRYEKVREQIPMEERLRIRSWQAEFRTLEKAKQTKKALDE
ncbi:DUF6565 domain-containing protein [Solirubrum puertoriconensis]|uniref:DUF349 domain-containing protein n=1 Tax=Solirubrum puertoriconensis TaxID=1751427 RepID=A0A9X0HP45_SOLP1|nr:DUF6565 domain-containing protein [Solirubrum puertoriconensis]KUG09656.1 hypothetical protein ASU33_18370 [Solirubrum puertoriconensis]